MSPSIVSKLVAKDFVMMRRTIAVFALISLASAGALGALHGRVPDWVLMNMAFVFLFGPMVTCGIVMVMRTNVMEKEKATQAFIMSLPLTVREFTTAKILVNLPVFTVFWLAVSAFGYYFAFGLGLLPLGAVPFVTMIFLGSFLAYSGILSVSLLSQSLPVTVLSIPLCEMGTSAYLWTVVFLEPIQRNIHGPVIVWDATAITVVAAQVVAAACVLLLTARIQTTKRDFL